MGYYSDVVLVIKKEIVLKEGILQNNLPSLLKKHINYDQKSKDVFGWYFTDVKWYTDRTDIKELLAFLDTLNCDDFGYLASGEDLEDVAMLGDPFDFDIWVTKNINLPFPMEEI